MKKTIKSFIFAAIFGTAMFINSTSVNAAYDDLKLKCLYKGANERIYVEFSLQDNSSTYSNFEATNFVTGEVFDYTTPMGIFYPLQNGCPDSIKKFKFDKSGKIAYGEKSITTLKSGTDVTDYGNLLEELQFLTMQSGSKDIFFWSSITSAGLDASRISGYSNRVHECSYKNEEYPNLKLLMRMDGSYKIIGNDSRNYKFVKDSGLVLYDSMTNNLRCPVTLCYNKEIAWAKDEITLSKDQNYECKGIDSHKNTNQQELASFEIEYDSPEQAAAAVKEEENLVKTTIALGDCYISLDTAQKCKKESLAFQKAAWYVDATRNRVYEPYKEYANEYQAFTRCVTSNYSQTEIANACSAKIADEKAAVSAVTNSKSAYVRSLLGFTGSMGSSYSLNEMTCEEIFGNTLIEMFNTFFNMIKIGGVLIVILFSMLEFTKAIISSDADALKKAFVKLKNRVIVIIILFLLPALIQYILETFEISSNTNPLCK